MTDPDTTRSDKTPSDVTGTGTPPPAASRHRQFFNAYSGRDVNRIQSFADAVFAVAMTLLVLDVRLPATHAHSDPQLLSQLTGLLPHLGAYLLSFVMLGTFWLALHTLLALCTKSDRHLHWAVLVFLFCVTLLPFTASVLADHTLLPLAIGLYWLNLAALGGTLAWVASRAGRFVEADRREGLTLVRRRLIFAQVMYAIAAALCLLSPVVSLAALGLFQLFFTVSPRLPWRI
jgi:uncharacterized membrane protein